MRGHRVRLSRAGARLAYTLVVSIAASVSRLGAQAPQSPQPNPVPWDVPARAAARANPVPSSPAIVKQGRELYHRDCELCHGTRGAGDGTMAASLPTKAANLGSAKVQSQSDGALFYKILHGRGPMPTTEVTLSDDERWAVVRYVRSFARRR